LIFAPHKRLNVDQCLVHPYVLQFHSPIDEPALNYDILLPLPDHIQLSIDDYRNKLYEMIQENRTYVKRIQHNRTNGQTIATNGRLSSVIRRSSSNNGIRTMKQQSVMEPKAPIAQAECSDTDYDTARSINRPVSIDKPKNIDTTMIENRQSRERAQSVETPQNGTVFRERTASSSSKVRPRRRSQHRTGIFSSFRKSTQHFAS
uniref:Non-specific serine/threonine protein kinase n=1 Tax=Brugia timori TaxID=42155 RepID=A0A0R3R2V7_9BILA